MFLKKNQLVFNMTWLVQILRIYLDEQLVIKAFNIAKNPEYDRYQKGLASVVYEFFDKTF